MVDIFTTSLQGSDISIDASEVRLLAVNVTAIPSNYLSRLLWKWLKPFTVKLVWFELPKEVKHG